MATAPTDPATTEKLSTRLRRGELLAPDCPSREVLRHLTSRWGVLLLMVLSEGVHRFSDLRRRVGGVSEKMLAQTLKWLEADGLVTRRAYDTMPPHVEYALTPLGRQAAQRVVALADWVERSTPKILRAREATAQAAADRAAPAFRGRSSSAASRRRGSSSRAAGSA